MLGLMTSLMLHEISKVLVMSGHVNRGTIANGILCSPETCSSL